MWKLFQFMRGSLLAFVKSEAILLRCLSMRSGMSMTATVMAQICSDTAGEGFAPGLAMFK